jgi:cytoskeletal protein RodZ
LPPRAYTLGLLTLYARYLGLDVEPLAALLPPEAEDRWQAPPPQEPGFPFGRIILLLIAAIIIGSGVCVWRGATAPEPRPTGATGVSDARRGPTAIPTSRAAAVAGTPLATAAAASSSPAPTVGTPPPASMPSLVGGSWQQALDALRPLSINPGRREAFSETAPQEQVLVQEPAAGQQVSPGGAVTLVVSLGRPGSVVPDVVGKPEAEARRLLTEAGLTPGRFANYQGSADVPDAALRSVCVGCVLSTNPGPGSQQPPGTQVFLAVRKE